MPSPLVLPSQTPNFPLQSPHTTLQDAVAAAGGAGTQSLLLQPLNARLKPIQPRFQARRAHPRPILKRPGSEAPLQPFQALLS